METNRLARLHSEDDFGGPTFVEPPLHLPEGTPISAVDDVARTTHSIVSIPTPGVFAAMAANNPRAMRAIESELARATPVFRLAVPALEWGPAVPAVEWGPTIPFVRPAPEPANGPEEAAEPAPEYLEAAEVREIDVLEAAELLEHEIEQEWLARDMLDVPSETTPEQEWAARDMLDVPSESTPQHELDVPSETTPEQEWAEFKKIGLGPKRAPGTGAAKLLVSTYRLVGFAILTAIVVALVSYVATTVFYMFSTSWLMPTVVSKTDEKVVALQSELAEQRNKRDQIADALAEVERAMAAEQMFQNEFAAAIRSDLGGRRSALNRVRQLAAQTITARETIRASSDEFAEDSSARMTKQFDAGMIDRHKLLDGKQQLAQISSSKLSLAERQVAFETQASELSRQAHALDAVLANKDAPLSYDVLKIKRDYDGSKLAVMKAVETRKTLLASLARQDQIIANLEGSAQLRVLADKATVALVPYANLESVKPGTALYACRLSMAWCRKVGTVLEILPGEIQFKHPKHDSNVRGQIIEMRLDDPDAARQDVLFAGGKPLGL